MLRTSACGGIGRRAGFRFQCPLGRGSSSLPRRTKDIGNENQVFGPGFFLLGKFGGHCGSQPRRSRSAHQSHQLRRLLHPALVPHRTPHWRYRAPTCADLTCPRSRRCRVAPHLVPPAAAPANPYSTTLFLNAQITSCTRLCVPVFAMADDRWVFTVDGSKNRVAAISLLLIP